MKSIVVFLLGVLVFATGCEKVTSPIANQKQLSKIELTANEQKLVETDNIFGFKVFNSINQTDQENDNLFISPLSISMALGMTLNGANGTTYEAMRETLELNGLTEEEINKAYKNIIALLIQHDPDVIFQIANSIWYAENFSVEQDFIDVNREYFDAEVSALDFQDPNSVNIINAWVNDQTNGKIEEIIEEIPPSVVMYLINAIYFNGTWASEFDEEATYNGIFYLPDNSQTHTPFMVQTNDFYYNGMDDAQVIDLPYGSGGFRMTVLLPNYNTDIDSLIQNLNTDRWNTILSSLTKQKGTLEIPKIKLEYKIKLKDVLRQLGMGIAFSGGADFSGIRASGGLAIDEVIHKTFLKINEEGTEAAAVTVVSIYEFSGGENDIDFSMIVNRPYLFAIRENSSNTILFMGKIANPEWEE